MPSLHVIGAGSLLEFEWERLSVPVGRIQYLYVRPFTFSEFLQNSPSTALIAEELTEFSYRNPIPAPVHEKLLGELKNFYQSGGMPRAIASFLETNSFLDVREEQRSIVQTYRTDFNKYCGRSGIEEIEKAFAALPRLIGRKTVYRHIDPGARPEQVRRAIHLMEKALVVHRILSTAGDGLPLEAGASEKHYKTALLDIGLMNALVSGRTQWSVSTNTSDHFTGAASEQFVAQECKNIYGSSENRGLNYWFRNKKGSTAEVDFLIEIDGTIIPLEVKAGSTGRMKSMKLFLSSHPNSPFGIRLCGSNFVRNDKIFTIPLYAASLLGPLCSRLLHEAG
jgi:predicted AAA+ superfamily ATPase